MKRRIFSANYHSMKCLALFVLFVGALHCQGSTVTSVTCTGGVATVTAANTFAANQGFELTGNTVSTYNVNATVSTANSTTFTFASTCNGTGTGGTVLAAWQILTLSIATNGTNVIVTDAFWLTTASPIACASCTSQYGSVTTAQLNSIKAGTTVEAIQIFTIPNTASTATMANTVETAYTNAQASVASGLAAYTGFCYNGSAWQASPCN